MEDSRKGKKDDEKGLSTSSPHVDREKGKEAIIYKTKKEKRKGTKNSSKIIARDMSEEILGINYTCNSNLFTLKPNILAQDQTSFLSCTLKIHCLGYVNLDPFPF